MRVLVTGGTGFIGRRLVRLFADRGHSVVCVGFSRGKAAVAASGAGASIEFRRCDVSNFDAVLELMADTRPGAVVHLAYSLGSEHPPHAATRLNVLGMDNVFEASRRAGVRRVVYASSLAVSGRQLHFGQLPVSELDALHGEQQYAMHKRFNEWQARDYAEKHGMSVIGVRPANGTGPDKERGSTDHVQCLTEPARGSPVTLPYRDMMRAVIHVDDIAEVFAQLALAKAPRHSLYNTGGATISLGELADLVREYLPEARIDFQRDIGGREQSGCYLVDNSRLRNEFGIEYPPLRQRVLQVINDVRRQAGLALISK
jgi:nucleoside-diphosphate-sugar epimerase